MFQYESPITYDQSCNAPHTRVKVTHLVYSSCLLGWNEAHRHSNAKRQTWIDNLASDF